MGWSIYKKTPIIITIKLSRKFTNIGQIQTIQLSTEHLFLFLCNVVKQFDRKTKSRPTTFKIYKLIIYVCV